MSKPIHHLIDNPLAKVAFDQFYYFDHSTAASLLLNAKTRENCARAAYANAQQEVRDCERRCKEVMQKFTDELAEAAGLHIEKSCTERTCYSHNDGIMVVVKPVKS